MTHHKYRLILSGYLFLTLVNGQASADISEIRTSSELAYKYDFDVNPLELDHDNNGHADLAPTWGYDAPYISGGKLVSHIDGDYIPQSLDSHFIYNGEYSTGTNLWETGVKSSLQPWTVEFKMKANAINYDSDSWFDLLIDPSIVSNAGADSFNVKYYSDHMIIKSGSNNLRFELDAFQDNTFRVASKDGKYYVWLNGTLLNSGLTSADGLQGSESFYSGFPGTPANISIGNLGPNTSQWELDYVYLDFTGGYAPDIPVIPEPTSASLAGLGLAMLLLRRRRAIS